MVQSFHLTLMKGKTIMGKSYMGTNVTDIQYKCPICGETSERKLMDIQSKTMECRNCHVPLQIENIFQTTSSWMDNRIMKMGWSASFETNDEREVTAGDLCDFMHGWIIGLEQRIGNNEEMDDEDFTDETREEMFTRLYSHITKTKLLINEVVTRIMEK